MGLFSAGDSLWLAARAHLWRFDNLLAPGQERNGCDRLYVPTASFRIGEVDAHELVVTAAGEPVFVNTAFSCLATIRPGFSFAPTWVPPFISRLAAEDRCHLNGVGLQDGQPTWATVCCQADSPAAWRNHRDDGGVVIHIPSGEVVASRLSMPHSPRWYNGRLWLLNSGTGEFGWIDLDHGQFQPVCPLPGFARGLAFHDGYAVVAISRLRSPQCNGLPLAQQLGNTDRPEGICGLRVIDLNTGRITSSLDLPEPIEELSDVALLPGVRQATVLVPDSGEADRLIRLPGQPELLTVRPRALRVTQGAAGPVPDQVMESTGRPALGSPGPNTQIRYQRIFHLTSDNLAPYAALTFPSLVPGSNAHRRLCGELVSVCALADDRMIGLAIAERSNTADAHVVSLMVQPDWRRRGVGGRLMHNLMQCLRQEGVASLHIQYQSGTEAAVALEPLLARLGWSEPRDTFLLLEGRAERLAAIPWADDYPIAAPYRLESWQPHHSVQANTLNAPLSLLAPIASQILDPNLSLALLHNEQLVGWVLADRTTPTQARYSSLFVAPAHRGRARGLALLASAFRRQGEHGPPIARAGVVPESDAMIRLANRHLRPYLKMIAAARHSSLTLLSGRVMT